MREFNLSYREVIPDQTDLGSSKEITLSTGGTQSTLQDIKVAERANGYCYEDSSRPHTRNRFIYWRINYDVLELVEHSLDINLSDNRVRYRFIDTPILDGISINETDENVIILVPTVCSVHRLIFPHPDQFHKEDDILGSHHHDLAAPSIFVRASPADASNPNTFYVFNNSNITSDQLPLLASSFLSQDNDAFFVLAYPSTELLLIKQTQRGQAYSMELKSDSKVPRFLSGFADKLFTRSTDNENIASLLITVFNQEPLVLTLCRDGQLKFWSCLKGHCVAVINILSNAGDSSRDHVQGAILRKVVNATDNDNTIVVFVSFATGCQFHILRPVIVGPQLKIERVNMLQSPENDLIDFAIQSNRLWSAWRLGNGECAVYTASLISTNCWMPIILETLPDSSQPPIVEDDKDPRQTYLEYIFYPGRFPLHIINKALCIYKRSPALSEAVLTPAKLKQRICMAIDSEIQNAIHETDVHDEDYLECANWCWQQFYSCVVQYHVAGMKPLGLLLLPSVSGAVFLKKTSFSFLRPLDILEHMALCNDHIYKDQFDDFPVLSEDSETTSDLMILFEVIVYLEQQVTKIFAQEFEKQLSLLESPDVVMSNLLEQIENELDKEFTSQVSIMLKGCDDLYKAVHKLLELLRFDASLTNNNEDEINPDAMHYFCSQLGVSFITGCLRQQAQIRFSICRNLLLICNILLEDNDLDWGLLEAIRSVCSPEIVVLIQDSYVVLWLSGLPAVVNLPHDASMLRLQPLKLAHVYNVRPSNMASVSLLELFNLSTGGYEARKMFARTNRYNGSLPHWHVSMISYLNHLRYFICPISGNTVLPEWLLSSGQNLWLQQYVRLLSKWCEWNCCTRDFLLASSLLGNGEDYKAEALFLTAAKGIFSDTFLKQRVTEDLPDKNQTKAYVYYYLKVIHLFELHKSRNCAINVANVALSIVPENDILAATLYSIKFKHQVALKHYSQAFESLNSNPDTERKKDNLRDLVKCLLDENQLDTLLNFTYGSMGEFFSNILLTRARATDAINNVFYDFLYSYQIKRGSLCHRLAASVMYEQAFRLLGSSNPDALEKQVKCYLAAKNVLQLCSPDHAWVVRPSDPDEEDEEILIEALAGSGEEPTILKLQKQVEVVNITTIKEDLLFASAKLKLVKFDRGCSYNISSPNELIKLLSNAGLFKTALQICTTFKLPYESVFESLTKHCIMLTEEELPNAWEWLVENDLHDLRGNRDNLADIVWQLLQDYLEKYEEPHSSTLHFVVCKKIINMRIFLPHWLLASYKLRNAAELLRLLHSSGRLDDAIELVNEYLLAAMGYGKELYGFEKPLVPTAKAFCLPVYSILCLINELKMQNAHSVDQPYLKEYKNLNELFSKYLETSMRISNEMSNFKMQL